MVKKYEKQILEAYLNLHYKIYILQIEVMHLLR